MAMTNIASETSGTLVCSDRHQKLFNFDKMPPVSELVWWTTRKLRIHRAGQGLVFYVDCQK